MPPPEDDSNTLYVIMKALKIYSLLIVVLSDLYAFNGIIQAGHGIRKEGSLPHEEITMLKTKYSENEILKRAFALMEGADLAVHHDVALFLKRIKENHRNVDLNRLYEIMENDKKTITQAVECFDSGDDKEKTYRPLLDLLHTLGSQGNVKGYKGKKGIEYAIQMIKKYGTTLLEGQIPKELENISSNEAVNLRIALFYIDLFKTKSSSLEKRPISSLKTFCPVTYFGKEQYLKETLSKTSFYEGDMFYAPSNGYVKNADVCVGVTEDELSELSLQWTKTQSLESKKYSMVFADCSGFAQAVARQFHSSNAFLSNDRQMSYQLAPLYDYLANEKMNTKGKFYDIDGSTRELTEVEQGQIKKFSLTIRNLVSVYEAVIEPLKNIKPGDLIVERGEGEGHVMIVVEQSPLNSPSIAVVELTSFQGTGYNWTRVDLTSSIQGNTMYRVLRIKL